jgi:hypothetical protein
MKFFSFNLHNGLTLVKLKPALGIFAVKTIPKKVILKFKIRQYSELEIIDIGL